ncbi:ABC transporter ATP-binding protein [Microbacterium sp. AG790]|uniref:ABC transporter ATP-binding protein n=1 Tax=Microbacterium sp. AG790 TaxID=2183995 RepID=UPI00217E22CE|nr:ABC transporter ATP-binding protein [Microbacterium sp. AG790]
MSAPHPTPADDDDGVHALPPLPVVPAAEAAAQLDRRDGEREDEPVAPPRPRRPAATPAAKRAPRPRKPKATPTPPPPDVPPAVAAARFEAAAPLSSIEPDDLPPRPAAGDTTAVSGAETTTVEISLVEREPQAEQPEPDVEHEGDAVAVTEAAVSVEDEPVGADDVQAAPEVSPEVAADVESLVDPGLLPDPDDAASPLAEILAVTASSTADDERPVDESVVDGQVDAVRLSGVTKTFGATVAVDAIDLRIAAGTFYGIVGPNGAGKTTTLSMIAGLLRPDSGEIRIAGVDLASAPRQAKQKMGILPDRLRTFDRLTGRQLLHYYGVLRGLRSAVVESRTAELARAFDLTDALSRPVSDYSAGMTKKIMLAGAMIHSPRVLVLDEPFESVDPVSSAVVLDILSAYVAHGGTVVLSSHGMELVERVCSGLAVIVGGRVLAEGTVDEVRGELTLEQRFIELSGGISDAEGLEWLHTFSD